MGTVTFSAVNQSQWWPGGGYDLSIDTGDSLIFSTGGHTDIGFDLLGNGIAAQAYVDLQVGLYAWASLGRSGSLDASLTLDLQPEIQTGLLIAGLGQTPPSPTFDVDLSRWSLVSSELSTQGFDASAGAGLDLVLKFEAGLRNASYYTWFGGGEFDDFKLISLDFTGDNAIPLVEVSSTANTASFALGDLVELTARLPTGANTQANTSYGAGDAATITASGHSTTRFLEMSVDVDALLVHFGSKLPGVGASILGLGETLFAERRYDLHDYVPDIPRDKLVLNATMLDFTASSGIVLSERNTLDFAGDDGVPNVEVTLTSDNGTPGYTNDDATQTVDLGGRVTFDRPVYGQGPVPGFGEITITADYKLKDVAYQHDIGFGLNTVFTISALQAELTGDWVPDSLKIGFGPLLSVDLPNKDGLTLDLFSLPLPEFALQDGAFGGQSETYSVFFTNELPDGATDESVLDAASARQAVIDHKLAKQENLQRANEELSHLIDPGWTHVSVNVEAGLNTVDPNPDNADSVTAIWDGDTTSTLDFHWIRRDKDFYYVRLRDGLPDGVLKVDLTGSLSNAPNYLGYDGRDNTNVVGSDARLLDKLGTADASYVRYIWETYGTGTPDFTLASQSPVDVRGGSGGDVLVYVWDGSETTRARYFDGQGQTGDEYDRFVANLAASHPDTPIGWDLTQSVMTGTGVTLIPDGQTLEVHNVEAITLETGNADDWIKGYIHADHIVTNGGDDIVILPGDSANDTAILGDGDDYILVELSGIAGLDQVWGGRGQDHATVVAASSAFGLELALLEREDLGRTSPRDAAAAGYVLMGLLDTYQTSTAYAGFDDPTARSGDPETDAWGHMIGYYQGLNHLTTSKVLINTTVEDLSVIGSEAGRDLVYYSGGSLYQGGDDEGDTLLADFGFQAALRGIPGGVSAAADGSPFTFGDSAFEGFDRFVVRGSDRADVLTGGTYADMINGGAGNDVLSGGDDSDVYAQQYGTPDTIEGGAGSDVMFWHDQGPDLMAGNTLDDPSGDPGDWDVLNIGGLIYSPFGMAWGVLVDDGNFGTGHVTRARSYLDSVGQFSANSSAVDILRGLDLVGDPRGLVGVAPYAGASSEAMMLFDGFDEVNVSGSDEADDLLIYLGGRNYDGGESMIDDRDTFAADFSAQTVGIELKLGRNGAAADQVFHLSNGVTLSGIDRLVLRAGQGQDVIHGNWLDDHIDGGAGNDRLFGGAGNDTLLGGAGNDVVFWTVDGDDSADGGFGRTGADADRLIVAGVDPEGASRGLGVWIDRGLGSDRSLLGHAVTADLLMAHLDALGAASTLGFRAAIHGTAPGTVIALAQSEFEIVDVMGSDLAADLVTDMGGTLYWGGDGTAVDTFVADLSDQATAFHFDATYRSPEVTFSQSGLTGPDGAAFANTYDIGNGTYLGGFERFGLSLGSGADFVRGGTAADIIRGGDGDDTLDGGGNVSNGTEIERVSGGAGNDLMTWRGGRAIFDGGAGDNDKVSFDAGGVAISLTLGFPDLSLGTYSAGFLNDFGRFQQLLTDMSNHAATTPDGAFVTYDGPGWNALTLRGVERITGHGSDQGDVLLAMSNRSQLFGDSGDDVLISGAGNDLLAGGPGADRYMFDGSFGDDMIAGEGRGAAALYFMDLTWAQLGFVTDGADLRVETANGSVRIQDYWVGGGSGVTFHTADRQGGAHPALSAPSLPAGPAFAGQTILGTPGNDTALGGIAGDDTIIALAGDDRIVASAGHDVMDGGAGVDVVSYSGFDSAIRVDLASYRGTGGAAAGHVYANIEGILAGTGAATLYGDVNNNVLGGSPRGDLMQGRFGDDLLMGQAGPDTLSGGDGDDAIFGEDGYDALTGGAGNDTLSGGIGRDTLDGGAGHDTLDGGRGDDLLLGGDGIDVLRYSSDGPALSGAESQGFDTLRGGAGHDTADASRFAAAVRMDLGTGLMSSTLAHRLDGTGGVLVDLARLEGIEALRGSDFGDLLIGAAGGTYFEGGGGDDTLRPGAGGDDTMFGGAGIDVVDYTGLAGQGVVVDFRDTAFEPGRFVANGFSDWIIGIEGVRGSDQADAIHLSDVGGLLWGNGGADLLVGGAGDDWLAGGAGRDSLDGGGGTDIYDLSDGVIGATVNLALHVYDDGHGTTDAVGGVEGVRGTGAADMLTGNAMSNLLLGGRGADVIRGGGGSDLLMGERGHDRLEAGVPQLILEKPQGQVIDGTATAPLLNDYMTLQGRAGAALSGDVPTATVHGATSGVPEIFALRIRGDQRVTVDVDMSERGFDSMLVLRDADWNLLAQADDMPFGTIDPGSRSHSDAALTYDFASGTDGLFYIELRDTDGWPAEAGWTYALHVSASGADPVRLPSAGSVLEGGAGDDTLTGNAGDDTLRGGAGQDRLIGNALADDLDGGAGADWLSGGYGFDGLDGGNGDDALYGGLGRDTLDGGQGRDSLTGGEGDDLLTGGLGYDSLTGGGGDDAILGGTGNDTMRGGEGGDRITGGDGQDRAWMGGGDDVFVDNVQAAPAGNDTVSGEGGDDSIYGGNGFDLFYGGAGSDYLRGGKGADTLYGGDQGDRLDGNDGNDVVRGGKGADYAILGTGFDIWTDDAQAVFGNDTVFGGGGWDTLTSAGGDDRLTGGDGADLFAFVAGIGDMVVTDYVVGEDRLSIATALWGGPLTQGRLDDLAALSGGGLVLEFAQGGSLTLDGVGTTAGLLTDIVLS